MAGTETKRIIELTEASTVQSGDFIAVDSNARGTKKVSTDTLATSAALTVETNARAGADEQMSERMDGIEEQTALIQNPTKTLSGALCSFTDGAAMPMVACTANIVPKQSGTGTPSPDNVRQISGWESVNLYDTGVNVWDEEWEQGGISPTNGGNSNNTTGIRSKNLIPIVPNTEYNIMIAGKNANWITVEYDENGNYLRYRLWGGSLSAVTRFTTRADAYYMRFQTNTVNEAGTFYGTTYNHDISINYPSTEHDYHAYDGDTYTTDLGRTVYGGTLDVVSGVLTAYPFYPSYNGETLDGRWICDRAVYAEGTTPPTGSQVALISGTGTTYTLTPTEVSTLLGDNNVWADSGDVEITYRRDISIVLENLENALSGSNSLNTMMMSAPTENTAEEPTEDEAEDDMR